MSIKVAINGFGRIGRNVFRAAQNKSNIQIVAVNDLTDAKTLGHLLKYDSVLGPYKGEVKVDNNRLIVDGKVVEVLSQRDYKLLPWRDLGVDVVVESTGLKCFTEEREAEWHIKNGARKVIISAPAKQPDVTLVIGVNDHVYESQKHHIISNASCTTNCLAPVAKVLHQEFTVIKGSMTTVHAYTNDQNILDLPHSDLRRARAAALSMIPTTTGAAKAIGLVLPELRGKLDGIAIRVPTPTVSLVDLVVQVEKSVSVEVVNQALQVAANSELKGILDFSMEPLVSIDYRGNPYSSVVDGLSTMVIEGNLVKVLAWYDNEWGYSNRVVNLIEKII